MVYKKTALIAVVIAFKLLDACKIIRIISRIAH